MRSIKWQDELAMLAALLLAWPAALPAQEFTLLTNADNTITITAFGGSDSALTIPNTTNGLPVTRIGEGAFYGFTNLISVTMQAGITNIGAMAFEDCHNLASVTIPIGVTSIEFGTFDDCGSLTRVAIPNSVTSIGVDAFSDCAQLVSVAIPGSVTNIGTEAFAGCDSLENVYFEGNPPVYGLDVFWNDINLTVYYLPGTWVTNWGSTFGGAPTMLWNPQVANDGSLGVQAGQFGFTITGTPGISIVVESCTNLRNPVWTPVSTNTLASGASYFSDSQWPGNAASFYRLRAP
jgi:hypothetical protein